MSTKTKRLAISSPITPVRGSRKSAQIRGYLAPPLGQRCPSHYPGQRGPNVAEQGPFYEQCLGPLGPPLDIRKAAAVIGCSPWTVRQKLIPMGLPCFRSGASGKLIFYLDQVVRWIEAKQKED